MAGPANDGIPFKMPVRRKFGFDYEKNIRYLFETK